MMKNTCFYEKIKFQPFEHIELIEPLELFSRSQFMKMVSTLGVMGASKNNICFR